MMLPVLRLRLDFEIQRIIVLLVFVAVVNGLPWLQDSPFGGFSDKPVLKVPVRGPVAPLSLRKVADAIPPQ
jgi:hypothetical protein